MGLYADLFPRNENFTSEIEAIVAEQMKAEVDTKKQEWKADVVPIQKINRLAVKWKIDVIVDAHEDLLMKEAMTSTLDDPPARTARHILIKREMRFISADASSFALPRCCEDPFLTVVYCNARAYA